MKKKALSLILASAMVASLAACGQEGTTATQTQSTATDAQAGNESSDSAEVVTEAPADAVVIEVWSNDRHDEEYVRSKIDEYNSTNTDGIYINLTTITDDYQNMIQLAFTGGDAPDVVGANSLPLNTFADTGILSPLDDYIAADAEFQKVNEPYENSYEGYNKRGGHLYSVYSGIRSGVRVEYNKNLLAQIFHIRNSLELEILCGYICSNTFLEGNSSCHISHSLLQSRTNKHLAWNASQLH